MMIKLLNSILISAMARFLFHNEGNDQYYNSGIDTFPYSLYRIKKYFTLENKKLSLDKFIKNLNIKLYVNVKIWKSSFLFPENMKLFLCIR